MSLARVANLLCVRVFDAFSHHFFFDGFGHRARELDFVTRNIARNQRSRARPR